MTCSWYLICKMFIWQKKSKDINSKHAKTLNLSPNWELCVCVCVSYCNVTTVKFKIVEKHSNLTG